VDSKTAANMQDTASKLRTPQPPMGCNRPCETLQGRWIKIADQLDENGGFRLSEGAADAGEHDRALARRQGPPAPAMDR
jgi:hypothetical protein